MHKHYPVLFAHSSSCVDWYISWVNDASVKTQREKDVYVCSAISLQQKSKITDLKSNQFSGFKLQNVIMQLISPVTLQEEAVALEAVLHLVLNFHREPKKIKNQHSEYNKSILLDNNKTGYHSGIQMYYHFITPAALIVTTQALSFQ